MKTEIEHAVGVFHRFGFKDKGKIPQSNLVSFQSSFAEILSYSYKSYWFPENPNRGSGFRCIRLNIQCIDPKVEKSLAKASISKSHLSGTELTIWVDPGSVCYRLGEDQGSIGVYYEEDVAKAEESLIEKQVPNRAGSVEDETELELSSSLGSECRHSPSLSPVMLSSPASSPSPSPSRQQLVPTPVEFNPYSPPAHISYPGRFQQISSPARNQPINNPMTPSQMPRFTRSPPSLAARSPPTHRPAMSSGENSGYIPTPSYTRPRNLFPAQDSGSYSKGGNHMGPQYSIPLVYPHAVGQLLDIPVMA